jgi:hypothetical protein
MQSWGTVKAANRPCLNSRLLSDTARHHSVIALWTVEAALRCTRDGKRLWMTSPAAQPRLTLHHISISKALPYVYSTPLPTPRTLYSIPFHRYSPIPTVLNHRLSPSPAFYSCYSFISAIRFPKTPIPVEVVGKPEGRRVLLHAKRTNYQVVMKNIENN